MIGLQKSPWGFPSGYVNVGIDLVSDQRPADKPRAANDCPVGFRADSLWDDPHEGLDSLLDLERSPNRHRGDATAIRAAMAH